MAKAVEIYENNGNTLVITSNGSFHAAEFYFELNGEGFGASFCKHEENSAPKDILDKINEYKRIADVCISNAYSERGYY